MPRPVEALRRALRELGYIEGQTLQIDYRWAEGRAERLPELAAGLVSSRVDLIVASGDGAIRAAMGATRTIPIVMATSGDAVGAGFVRSLAFPGANVTGMTAMVPELGAKRLQLLRSLRSDASRVAVLWSPADPVQALEWKEMRLAAPVLGVSLQGIEFRTVADVDAAIDDFDRRPPQLLVVFNAGATLARRQQLLERVAKVGSIAMYEASEWVAEGGLISYGVTHADLFSRSATFIDKILKGAVSGRRGRGWGPSMGDYVTGPGATRGEGGAGGRSC